MIQNTMNQFLLCNAMDESVPITGIDKGRCQTFKKMLMDGNAASPTKRKPGPVAISHKLSHLRHFTKWCLANDFIHKDPMAGVTLPPKMVANARTAKEEFTNDDLEKIFKALAPYKADDDPMRREWYWVTVLLAHSGARATEIIQLYKADVKQEDGIWMLSISDKHPGQHLKNRASHRMVPVHSAVIANGFIEWMQIQPDGQLFPLLLPYGAQKASGWTTDLLEELGLKRKEVTQHSFRHGIAVRLDKARVHYSLCRRLLGHALGKDVEARTYLRSLSFDAKELSEAIESIKLPPLHPHSP